MKSTKRFSKKEKEEMKDKLEGINYKPLKFLRKWCNVIMIILVLIILSIILKRIAA